MLWHLLRNYLPKLKHIIKKKKTNKLLRKILNLDCLSINSSILSGIYTLLLYENKHFLL